MKKYAIVLVAMLFVFASIGMASNVRVTNYPTSASTQIWINVADYDSRSQSDGTNYDFVENTAATDALSGAGYWFPNYDGPSTLQPWWAEYSIDANDVSGVTLDGTWYFWARAKQFPGSIPAEDSDLVFVKNDPNDGSGETWYSTALSGADITVDRILNGSLSSNGNNWAWASTDTEPTVFKQFNLEDGKITFRISERESGPDNAVIDAICWTDDPTFTPTDGDYLEEAVADGLVLSMDASQAGGSLDTVWSPVLAPNMSGGDLFAYSSGVLPYADIETVADGNDVLGYNWFYSFDPVDRHNSSHVINLDAGGSLNFDYDEDFTIETWFRADTVPHNNGRGAIFGNKDPDIGGYRLGIRTHSNGTEYYPEFNMRDTIGAEKSQLGAGGSIRIPYADNSWQHLVAVYDGNATGTVIDLYINGTNVRNQVRTFAATEPDFVPDSDTANIGGIMAVYPFDGDVSIVRVYDRLLIVEEIQRNYSVGMLSDVTSQCAGQINDFDNDCDVDLADFARFASYWLESNFITN